ncbi:MAG: hypothetical protein HYW15_02705 [Candidatus Giovannonibacteria bacterium]|nr:MAG: hypothetical protein HYW15_02705 [Candidatus Giovannonibacteria bacterium]
MNKKVQFIVVGLFLLFIGGVFVLSSKEKATPSNVLVPQTLAAKFDYLSKNGNSSCSATFRESIPSMPDTARLQGSCCSPMSMHRYNEQIEGLKKYSNIPEIPPDPYDVEVGLAKKLMGYYDMKLTPEEQKVYEYAMQNSDEKGPCCCKCWRWYVYGGLGKLLIQKYGFTGEQVTEVWNLSDGCGGADDHLH